MYQQSALSSSFESCVFVAGIPARGGMPSRRRRSRVRGIANYYVTVVSFASECIPKYSKASFTRNSTMESQDLGIFSVNMRNPKKVIQNCVCFGELSVSVMGTHFSG